MFWKSWSKDQEAGIDTFDGAWFDFAHHPEIVEGQAPPFRVGKEAPLSVNPEQAPAFRPESRRVDFARAHGEGGIIVPCR